MGRPEITTDGSYKLSSSGLVKSGPMTLVKQIWDETALGNLRPSPTKEPY